MKRRGFIKSVGLSSIGIPLILKDFNFGVVSKELFKPARSAEDRVLVIIRLNGGNDGLNTLIPLDQYDHLNIQRSNILIPENQLINITPSNGLHPVMTGMADMFQNGRMSIIQNVGYPEQNRSHFRSTDIWTSGVSDAVSSTGWLGRNFDHDYPNYPADYPNSSYPDPFAIAMGYEVSATCQGLMGNFSITVTDPLETFNLQEAVENNDGTYYGSHMEYLAMIIAQTNEYGSSVYAAANAGSSLSTMYDANNPLAVQLKNVAKMISGGLKTKVYVLNIDGFDTHDSQVTSGNLSQGNHAALLKMLSDAVAAFQNDLLLLGLEDRVAGMTFSEFGRQIASNASLGTDHGDAAPLFLFGACISSQIVGPNPVISDQIVDQAGVPMQIDFRDVYASILKDWFLADPADIQTMFDQPVSFFPILDACTLGMPEYQMAKTDVLVYPNPCSENTTVRFVSENETVTIQVRDMYNRLIKEVCNLSFTAGQHDVPIDMHGTASGQYLVTVSKKSGNFSTKLHRVAQF